MQVYGLCVKTKVQLKYQMRLRINIGAKIEKTAQKIEEEEEEDAADEWRCKKQKALTHLRLRLN